MASCILALAAASAGVASGAGRAQQPRAIVLGKTVVEPPPSCPRTSTCEVIARVTGVQIRAAGVEQPFRAPVSGRIVAWWLRLPSLRPAQLSGFSRLFGGEPTARLAVLRQLRDGQLRLVKESGAETLTGWIGQSGKARFSLVQPLAVRRGDLVGVTTTTWLPAFAVGLSAAGDAWLASRPRSRCAAPSPRDRTRFDAFYRRNDAHLGAGVARRYDCTYRTARILYWARLVPDRR